MEVLQRLTRRQVDALQVIGTSGNTPRGIPLKDIAATLRVQPPSALAYVSALEELGLVIRYRGKTQLSGAGHATLEEYYRHHQVAERMFTHLGLSPEETCKAAQEVDLAISHRTVQRLVRHTGSPPRGGPHPLAVPAVRTRRTGG